jgi:hypothetical protein
MMPQVALDFPTPHGKKPFQKEGTKRTLQGKEKGGGNGGERNTASLDLQTAKENKICGYIA